MRGLAGSFLTVALFMGACQPTLACDEPNALVPDPAGTIVPGIRLGPLLVSTGMWNGEQTARLPWARAEDFTKFLIAPVERLDRRLTLTGRRCEDGRALRFAEGPWRFDAEPTLADIERHTNPSKVIEAPPPANVQVIGADKVTYGGYFIFTAPGRWRIEARDEAGMVATAVIEVVSTRG